MVSSFWNSPLSKVTKRVSAPEKSPPPPPPSRSAKSSPPPPPTSKFWSSPLSKVTKTPVIRKPSSGSSGKVTGTTISSPPARGEGRNK